MRAVWLGGSANAPSTSAVNYYALTGDLKHTPTAVELARANILTDDVEITSIAAIVGNAPGTGKSWTLAVRNAGATTAASVTIGNTDQSAQWSGSVICPADTRLGLSITPSGTPAAIGSIQWVIGYQTGGNFYVAFSGRMSSPSGTLPNQYIGFNGAHDNAPSSSITAWAELAPTGYTVTKLGMAMGSSVLNGATVRCGKQGMATVSSSLAFVSADGNDAIGTLGTALHVDAGETAQIHLAAGGSLAWNPYLFSATIVPDIPGEQILSYSDTVAPSTTVTQYVGPSGQNNGAWNATEATVALRAPDVAVTKLYVQQVTAPGSGKSRDYTLRRNGADAPLVATVSGTATDANSGSGTPAAPTVAAVGTVLGNANRTTVPVPVPAGTAADEVVFVVIDNTSTIPTALTPPAGFTLVPNSTYQTVDQPTQLRVYWKRCTGTDTGTYDFTFATANYCKAVAMRISGAITTGNPIDTDVAVGGNAATLTGLALTTSVANALLVWAANSWGTQTLTPPSGFASNVAYASSGGLAVGSVAQPAAGATGTKTGTITGYSGFTEWMGAIKPAAASPPAFLLGDQLSIKQTPTGTPAATAGVKISVVLLISQNVTGAIAATMRAATASLNGQVQAVGVIAATLRPPSIAMTGQNSQAGALAATMRSMAVALTGSQQINGTMVLALRAAVAQLVGSGNASGTMALQMRQLIALLDGDTTSGEIAVTLRRLIASVNGSQTVRGVLAATMRQLLFAGNGTAGSQASITALLRAPVASLVGLSVDVSVPPTPPALPRFKLPIALPSGSIVSQTQIVTLRTAQGVQLDQWRASEQLGLKWTLEQRETSVCELSVINDGYRPGDIMPWIHWIDVFDDQGRTLLWSGPVTARSIGREQVSISARDTSALTAKTRVRLVKKWDATDPAVIAGEHYAELIDHHGLNTKAVVREDPMGDRFDFSSKADGTQVDGIITQLVSRGLYWSVVRGVPVLGPWDRKPVAALGEDDFLGDGIMLTCDGTSTYNDILLRAADNIAHAIVPMGGLSLQQTVTVDDVFGVSNADMAVRLYARYAGSLRDTISLPQGSILHPDAPITIDQLIPSARVTVTAFDMTFLMEVTQVEVNSGSGMSGSQVSVTLTQVDDDLPELIEMQERGTAR